MIFSLVAATMISRSSNSRSEIEGFNINWPSLRPTLTSEIGPLNGMSETDIAAEAANAAIASGIVFLSPDISEIITCVSEW